MGRCFRFKAAKTAKRQEGEDSLQSLLQVSDGSVRSARGGVAVLNRNIGVPARLTNCPQDAIPA